MMCENKKKPVEKVKEELNRSKKKLNESICDGEDKLCEFLATIWKQKPNKTPANGNEI